MTNKKFRKMLRAYYANLNTERPNMQLNMKLLNDMCRNCKIRRGVKFNYNESMYQHIYDVITLKVEP